MSEGKIEEGGKYLPVVYARSLDEAEWYCQVLEDHDIPAIMDEDYKSPLAGGSGRRGVPVLVPESLLEDAQAYIAQLEEMDDFSEDEADEADDEFGEDEGFHTEDEAERL